MSATVLTSSRDLESNFGIIFTWDIIEMVTLEGPSVDHLGMIGRQLES